MILSGKIIVITGASSGIGKATAMACAAAGASLIITGRRKDALNALAKELGTPCLPLCFDVRDKDAVFSAFASLPAEFANVSVLINNAGLALGLEPVPHINLDDWEQMIDTNIKGVLYCTQALVPTLQKQPAAHIVNIGSTAGNYAYKGGNTYCASKAFVKHFSDCLRTDFLGQNIRVTNIEPAMTDDTAFTDVRFKGDESKARRVYEGVQPLRACDIAESIVWALTRPAHVNINRIELMPTAQAQAGLAVHRKTQG